MASYALVKNVADLRWERMVEGAGFEE
ncbi:hypothetical protein PENNAL_c0107G02618 [Penicillium nalgiovense]|uniref:Uncharacterized protein n=1 Tax=Penicillium nalgiovense TaxID=60175 RepID=A0A1V6X860_PENNA|nr:hypothetical protein PENNAL_c0107G02618 [Penicillium nalgiovense]